MKILLDTHAFLWFIAGDLKLSAEGRRLIEDEANEKLVSIASVLEIAIKVSLGKAFLDRPFEELVPQQIYGNDFHLYPLTVDHAIALSRLPFHHRDPFDRMIIAQSVIESIPVVSSDGAFDSYGIKRFW